MKLKESLLYWLKPDTCDEVGRAIDSANIRAVHILGLIIAIMESVALVIYFISHLRTLGEPPVIDAILRVLVLIVLSLAAFFVSDRLLLPGGSRSLKRLMIDRKIPAALRDALPVLADSTTLLAAAGLGPQARCIAPAGAPALTVEFLPPPGELEK